MTSGIPAKNSNRGWSYRYFWIQSLLWVCLCLHSFGKKSAVSPYLVMDVLCNSSIFEYSKKLFLSFSPSGIFLMKSCTLSFFLSLKIFLTWKPPFSGRYLTSNLFEVNNILTPSEAISFKKLRNYSWLSSIRWSTLSKANRSFLYFSSLAFKYSWSCSDSSISKSYMLSSSSSCSSSLI